jgi:cobalamin biosynthesis protein CobT
MAKRGGGSGSDLKSQLGSFFRSTLQQLDTVREVVTQKSKAGRLQIDLALLRRKRKAALADLGEVVAKLCAEGRLDEDEFPELGSPLARVESLDEQIDSAERKARRAAFGVGDRDDSIDEEPMSSRRARRGGEDEDADDLPDDDREEYFDDEPAENEPAPRAAGEEDEDDDGRYDPVDSDEDAEAEDTEAEDAEAEDAEAEDAEAEDAELDDEEPTPPPRPRK